MLDLKRKSLIVLLPGGAVLPHARFLFVSSVSGEKGRGRAERERNRERGKENIMVTMGRNIESFCGLCFTRCFACEVLIETVGDLNCHRFC